MRLATTYEVPAASAARFGWNLVRVRDAVTNGLAGSIAIAFEVSRARRQPSCATPAGSPDSTSSRTSQQSRFRFDGKAQFVLTPAAEDAYRETTRWLYDHPRSGATVDLSRHTPIGVGVPAVSITVLRRRSGHLPLLQAGGGSTRSTDVTRSIALSKEATRPTSADSAQATR